MSKTLVMVGTEKGAFILESDRDRQKWHLRDPLMKGWKVLHLALDQRSRPLMTACIGSYVYGTVIQISEDLGKTWTQVEHGPAYPEDAGMKLQNIWCVAPGPVSEPDVFYAGVAEAGIFRSDDRGLHWAELTGLSGHASRGEWSPGLGGLCCHSILVDPDNPNTLYVGISAVGVFRSDDAGITWVPKNRGLTRALEAEKNKEIGVCVHRLVIDEANPHRLYQQNHKGVFRSENRGDSWERIESGLPCNFGFPMVVHPRNTDTVYIVPQESDEFRFPPEGKMSVYRTTNGGINWQALRTGLPDNCYAGVLRQAMAVDAHVQAGVYFGTTAGQLFCSADEGESWNQLPYTFPRINSISVAIV